MGPVATGYQEIKAEAATRLDHSRPWPAERDCYDITHPLGSWAGTPKRSRDQSLVTQG
jgi:hypothetical protein